MSEAQTAGALLRAARERQGLHIAALAASIKVTPRKLEALEADRYGELPDATFTRALAQTVCRVLKIDPQPVLALLPQTPTTGLENVAGSLNQPFRQRSARDGGGVGLALAAVRPMVWAGVALLVAAAVVSLAPSSLWQPQTAAEVAPAVVLPPPVATAAPASAPQLPAVAPPLQPEPAAPQPLAAAAPVAAAAASEPAFAGGPPLRISTEQASWVQVRDGRGQLLLSRTVNPGENVDLDGVLPMRLTIGNAPGTRVTFRGKAVDLTFWTRETVARLELE